MMNDRPCFVPTHAQGHSLHARHLVGSQNILSAETLLLLIDSSRETSCCRHENFTRQERQQP